MMSFKVKTQGKAMAENLPIIQTNRLILRQWKDSDREMFGILNADPETLKYFPKTLTQKESNAFIDKSIEIINRKGYGLFAVEIKETNEFIGFTGLAIPSWEAQFTPCTEIGWRLYKDFWGKGYATESANAVLKFAFNELKLNEVVSFTSPYNVPSINVMKRIGMTHDPDRDFEHPRIEVGNKLRRHVFYAIKVKEYKSLQNEEMQ